MKQNNFCHNIHMLKDKIEHADYIVIGAGSGLSTSAGLTYDGKRFTDNFQPFIDKYGITDMYSAGFYPYLSSEEKWAYWAKQVLINRYEIAENGLHKKLYELFKDKNYFVLTTNVDGLFEKAGFDTNRIFATQGDYKYFQCKKACHNKLYYNESQIRAMVAHTKNCKIPSFLIPKCPVCGGEMEMNLRCDNYFVQDKYWYECAGRYDKFIKKAKHGNVLFLELGVGLNTPGIIKYPFWQMTYENKRATYACVNFGNAICPSEIKEQSICLDFDIKQVIDNLINFPDVRQIDK